MTSFSINIQRTRWWLWYRTFGVINCVYANSDDSNMAISHINQWGKSRYFCRSPSRMKTTAVVFISLPGVYMLNFLEGTKHIFTFCVIPPYWHDAGSWNLLFSKIRTYLLYIINIMGVDVLMMVGARASATIILPMLNWMNSVPAY